MDTFSGEAGAVAIVGLAGRFPSASSASELWTLLRDGKSATRWLTDEELRAAGVSDADLADPDYVRASLVLPGMDMFDAEFFGFSKRDAAVLDPQHRHFLECAWEALEDAGHMPENFPGAIGVFGGCGMQAYMAFNLLTNPQLVKSMGLFLLRHTGNDKDFLTSRVSYLLDLKGPSMSIQTACSTSLVAVHVAAQSLLAGECDMALAGGVSIELPHAQGYRYAEGEILSRDGHCRAFDDAASGTVFGSGAGIVVLRRLEDAIRDRDNIYAVICGSAVNNDGLRKAGYLAPSVDGQARAAVEALAVAGIDPSSVSYIEAHGTGTPVGDPIEIAALLQAYGGGLPGSCGIGSLKTSIGHLDTAAGVASLIKVALALRNGLIPASLNFSKANSHFDLAATPFTVVDKARPWPAGASPRRAAVNALGVGGTNAHVVVQEPPQMDVAGSGSGDDPGWQLVALSARTPASLERLKAKWCDFLASPPQGFRIQDAAYTTQEGRKHFEHRCAVMARDPAGLRAALQAKSDARCVSGRSAAGAPAVVLMFPGGGAHYPGAGRELLGQPGFAQAVEECFSLMPPEAPQDLRSIMFESDPLDAQAASTLEKPSYALVALFTLEYALAKLWESWGIKPTAVIGHSAGDYAAACIAGVMSVADALSIVVLRGQLFEAATPGAMLSVDLPEQELCALMAGLELDIAAINAPDLCMASGPLPAIAQLQERLAARGVEGRRLRINVAAHSHLLDGVLATFRERLGRVRLNAPQIPFMSNLTGSWGDAQQLTDPEYWVSHLRKPVRFSDGLRAVFAVQGMILVEAGPGQGLCALARQNGHGKPFTVLPSTCKAQEPNADLARMLTSAGALWAQGCVPAWQALRGAVQPRRISLPTYAFDHQRHWIAPGVLAHAEGVPQVQAVQEALALQTQAPPLARLAGYETWLQTVQWVRAPLPVSALPARGSRWLVLAGGGEPGDGIASQMASHIAANVVALGGEVTQVRCGEDFARLADGSFTIDPADPLHFSGLLSGMEQAGSLPDHIIDLWPLEAAQAAVGPQLPGQLMAFDSLVHLAKAIQELDLSQPMQLTVVTAGSQCVAGEAVPHPERALALGPCRVMPRELPNLTARLVDLAATELATADLEYAAAKTIVAECLSAGGPDLVAWRGGDRWRQEFATAPAPDPSAVRDRILEDGVYLITGGLGAIALELAGFLASTKKARLALVSRRTVAPQATWRSLAASQESTPEAQLVRRLVALEDAGAQVLVFSADVTDPEAMARVVAGCRHHFGAIHGVFHAAGEMDDGAIATKSAESIQRVLGAKAGGAQVLHQLFAPGELDLFAVFSSTSVCLGPAGQVDYVAANAYLDALAASRPDGLCLHWGIWSDIGMAARAYLRAPEGEPGVAGKPGIHPLLGTQTEDGDGAVFEASYAPDNLWVLHEHVVAGRPVLPGTAYVQIATAAMAVLHPGAAVEIRALSFEEAMVFDPQAPRRVRIEMRRGAHAAYDFVVRSRAVAEQPWQEHARATVSVFTGSLPAAPAEAAGAWRKGEVPQEHAVAFGPRWHSIARMRLGQRHAVAELELDPRYAGDLADYPAHPALTDMAATFGLHLLDAAERQGTLYVPLSIDRIRLCAPLPLRCVSRVQRTGSPQARLVSFDASLHTPDGVPIATFEGFSLRGVAPGAVAPTYGRSAKPEASLVASMLACGIRAGDARELFARVFSAPGRDLVVSSIALPALQAAIASAQPKPAQRASPPAADVPGRGTLNPVEAAIADAWRELLGVDAVQKDDDFFALGGHSLAAVRLFARIRKQFGVDLPLATLFQAPTLAALAAVVAETGGINTEPVGPLDTPAGAEAPKKAASNVIAMASRSWSPLVTICKGQPDRKPLFCVHGAGGNVLNFKSISDRLGRELPFYGLQAQGVDGRLPPHTSIEAMAQQYVAAVRSVDANGPYRLAGYSGGGVIALEMAQQLKKAGASISVLAMVDTLSPTATQNVSLLKKLWLMRKWSLQFAIDWPARRARVRHMRASHARALETLSRGEPLPPELAEFHLFEAFVAAQRLYKPAAYDGAMTLFRAGQGYTPYLNAGPALGWQEHIHGGIHTVEIAGSHVSLLSEPGLSQLVQGLQHCLGASEGGSVPAPELRSLV